MRPYLPGSCLHVLSCKSEALELLFNRYLDGLLFENEIANMKKLMILFSENDVYMPDDLRKLDNKVRKKILRGA